MEYLGFDVIFYPIKNGRRFGVYGAMINSVRTRPSLTIRKFSLVKKVRTAYFFLLVLNNENARYRF